MAFLIENGVLLKYTKEPGVHRVTVPDGVTVIGRRAFYKNNRLTEVIIPEGVTCIEREAFYYCTALQNIVLPQSLTQIGSEAFSWCNHLTRLRLPDALTVLQERVFFGCTSLEKITLPEQLREIQKQAFGRCRRLASLQLPEGLACIGENVFSECESLTHLELPSTVKSCGRDTLVRMAENRQEKADFLFFGDRILYCYQGSARSVHVPEDTRRIESGAFLGHDGNIDEIFLPDTIGSIDIEAFPGRQALQLIRGQVRIPMTYYSGSHHHEKENRRFLDFYTEPDIANRKTHFALLRTADYKIPAAAFMAAAYEEPFYISYLRRLGKRAAEYFILRSDPAALSQLLPYLCITSRNIDALVEFAIAQQEIGCQSLLLHHKAHAVGYKDAERYFKL